MKTRTIRQTVTFKSTPHEVYEALMDPLKHTAFTGARAAITPRKGGAFSTYGGAMRGTILELVPDRKIVQFQRHTLKEWPERHFARATFSLKPTDGGTRLELTNSGVPEPCFEAINSGWKDYYWTPMKRMLEGSALPPARRARTRR